MVLYGDFCWNELAPLPLSGYDVSSEMMMSTVVVNSKCCSLPSQLNGPFDARWTPEPKRIAEKNSINACFLWISLWMYWILQSTHKFSQWKSRRLIVFHIPSIKISIDLYIIYPDHPRVVLKHASDSSFLKNPVSILKPPAVLEEIFLLLPGPKKKQVKPC